MSKSIAALALTLMTTAASALPCAFVPWTQYAGTQLRKHPTVSAYVFETAKVKVDADGAPNAYHPADIGLHCTHGTGFRGLDCPANAGYPNQSWWRSAILPDPKNSNRAFVQPEPAEFAGYFVSQTTLSDRTKASTDPTKYVDSRNVPYLVFPGEYFAMAGTGVMGDFGYAINVSTGKASAFVVAEVGPSKAELGEMSIALATALGGTNPNPRTGSGVPAGKTIYLVFPRSRLAPAWPVPNDQIAARVDQHLESVGGTNAILGCQSP